MVVLKRGHNSENVVLFGPSGNFFVYLQNETAFYDMPRPNDASCAKKGVKACLLGPMLQTSVNLFYVNS